ncbi:hypothetical protein ACFWVP_11810 [Streptomyces sp. NPDC058637]
MKLTGTLSMQWMDTIRSADGEGFDEPGKRNEARHAEVRAGLAEADG